MLPQSTALSRHARVYEPHVAGMLFPLLFLPDECLHTEGHSAVHTSLVVRGKVQESQIVKIEDASRRRTDRGAWFGANPWAAGTRTSLRSNLTATYGQRSSIGNVPARSFARFLSPRRTSYGDSFERSSATRTPHKPALVRNATEPTGRASIAAAAALDAVGDEGLSSPTIPASCSLPTWMPSASPPPPPPGPPPPMSPQPAVAAEGASGGERSGGERSGGERSGGERSGGERSGGERSDGERRRVSLQDGKHAGAPLQDGPSRGGLNLPPGPTPERGGEKVGVGGGVAGGVGGCAGAASAASEATATAAAPVVAPSSRCVAPLGSLHVPTAPPPPSGEAAACAPVRLQRS
eukprot:1306500-Prymnesium_polylepis.1